MNDLNQYQKLEARDLRLIGKRAQDGIESQLMILQTPFGYRRTVEMFSPELEHVRAAILYVHWYEPSSPLSNRSQFAEEAREMAEGGTICLLVETLWSDPDFFLKRTQVEDIRNSIEEVANIRRAMDLLLSQPGLNSKPFAFVGHDFGGMYGALAGSLDQRPTHYVLMAATPRFPDWYLYAPRLDEDARQAFIHEFAPLDPVTHVPNLAPAPVLFQFGTDDPHVSKERGEEFFAAANQPKEIRWYEAGHGLNDDATRDRKQWLKDNLGLKQ